MIRRAADNLLRAGIMAVFLVLLVCVVWQVVSRYVLGTPSTTTDELARFLFMWLALTGGAYTYGQGRHLAIDLLPLSLNGRPRLLVEALITLLIAAFAGLVMVWGGGQLMLKTLVSGQISPALQVPMGWVYGAVPVSGLIILAYAAGNLVLNWAGKQVLTAPDDPEATRHEVAS